MNGSVTVIDIVAQVTDATEPGASSSQKNISKLERSISNLQKQIQGMKGESKLEVMATLKDMASKGIQNVAATGKKIAGKVWTVTLKAVDLVTAPFQKVLGLIGNPITQMAAFAGISLGIGDAIKTFMDFDAAMSQVSAISGATGASLESLTKKAREMGKTTQFTSTQAAEAFNYMAMAGWKSEDMLGGIDGILSLAAASGEDLATTSDIVTDAMTAFGLQADEAEHFADVLAVASSNANTNVGMMGESFKYAAPVAGAMGYNIEDTAMALGLMANSGIKASQGGTALRGVFTRLVSPTKDAAELMKKYGISLQDSHGNMKSLRGVMDNLRTSLGGLSTSEQTLIATELFGQEAMSGALSIINASEADYNKLADAVNHAEGAAKSMADTMQDNLKGSITKLQSASGGLLETVGGKLEPYFRRLADWLTACMPEIETAAGGVVDCITGKIDDMMASVHELTTSPEWQNAETLWDKIKLAWDKIIAEPFSEWWNGTGKAWLAGRAESVGSGLGSALHDGILGILGIDAGGVAADGVSIGQSFSDAFLEGFQPGKVGEAIVQAIKDGLKGLFSDAATLLPGGKEASSTSGLSAAILGYGAFKAVKTGYNIYKGGKTLINGGKMLVGGLRNARTGIEIARAAQHGGAAAQSALAMAENGALGVGTQLGAQFAGIAGTVAKFVSKAAVPLAAVTSAIEMGADAYHGVGRAKEWTGSDSTGAKVASGIGAALGGTGSGVLGDESVGKKVLNVGGGALKGAGIGAAVGSIIPIPGIGAAIGGAVGAGVGAIGAAIGGENIAKALSNEHKEGHQAEQKETEQSALKARKIFVATGRSIENVKFETSALNHAINDSEVSAEQFGLMFQEAVGKNLQSHFGNLKLSLEEVQNVAKSIVFDNHGDQMEHFAEAAQQSTASIETLKSRIQEIDRLNWEAELGLKMSEESIATYKNSMKSLAEEARSYLLDKHYEADIAIHMLVGEDGSAGIREGLNGAYEGLQSQMDAASAELQSAVSAALSDGVISATDTIKVQIGGVEYEMDEASAVAELQERIAEIANKVSTAQQEAKLEALKIRFGGAKLDVESFAALQEEMQESVASFTDNYNQALELGITNVKMSLEEGAINPSEYEEQVKQLAEGYEANIEGLHMRVESFQLDTIAEAFGTSLDGILSDMEGTTSEKLSKALNNALATNPEPMQWSQEQIVSWFGLEGLGAETQTAVSELLQKTAETIPQSMRESISASIGAADYSEIDFVGPFSDEFLAQMQSMDFSTSADALTQNALSKMSAAFAGGDYSLSGTAVIAGVGSAIQNADMGAINSAVDQLKANTALTVHSIFGAGVSTIMPVKVKADYKLINPSAVVRVGGGGSGTATLTANISDHNRYANGGIITKPHVGLVAEDGAEAIIPLSEKRRGRGIRLWERVGQMFGVKPYAEGGITGVAEPWKKTTGNGGITDITKPEDNNPKPPKELNSPKHPDLTGRTNWPDNGNCAWFNTSVAYNAATKKHAEGGIMTKPHVGLVAEDGVEAIIPLSRKRRGRGIRLWEKAGQMLGVKPYVEGGITGVTEPKPESTESIHNIANVTKPCAGVMAQASSDSIVPSVASPCEQGTKLWRQVDEFYQNHRIVEETENTDVPVDTSSNTLKFDIHMNISPQFVIESTSNMDEETVVAVIQRHIKEMVDDISDELAERLARVFANMPVKTGV